MCLNQLNGLVVVLVMFIFRFQDGFDWVDSNLNTLNVFGVLQFTLVDKNVPLLHTYYTTVRAVSVIVTKWITGFFCVEFEV